MFTDEDSSDFPGLDEEGFPFCAQVDSSDGKICRFSLKNNRDAKIIFKGMVPDPEAVTLYPASGSIEGNDTISIDALLNREVIPEKESLKIKFLVIYADNSGGDTTNCNCGFQSLQQRIYEKTISIPLNEDGIKWRSSKFLKQIPEMKLLVTTMFLGLICVLLAYKLSCRKIEKSSMITKFFCDIPYINRFIPNCSLPTRIEVIAEKICSLQFGVPSLLPSIVPVIM